ncbi:MAG: sodium ion-translocating decarboxylase subunit beta [Candidatus Bathyarchaeota archaeon]
MVTITILDIFPGLSTFLEVEPIMAVARIMLIIAGGLLVYLGFKNIIEPLVMIPMGFGMLFVNAGVLMMPGGQLGTLFVDPFVSEPAEILDALQIYFLQPIYTLTFSNGLIAVLIFLGIGTMTDIDFLISKPILAFSIAIAAELGTVVTLPLAVMFGFSLPEAAAIATIGGADGPMVLYASIILAKHLFVPITVVAYLYLSIIYIIYPFMIKGMVPKAMRGILMNPLEITLIPQREKFIFAIIMGAVLCLLVPSAAPLLGAFFFGVAIKESGIRRFKEFSDILVSGGTLFLGFVLGSLLSADVLLNPQVSMIAVLGMVALLISGVGGISAGLIISKLTRGRINPLIGVAGVSCVPTTAKIAQKCAKAENKNAMLLPFAMGPCVAGVITSAIIAGFYVAMVWSFI